MAHFAKLDENNVVTEVIVINNEVIQNLPFPESEPIGVAFCQSLYGADTVWKQTSYNANFRSIYAGIGDLYDPQLDQFKTPPKPLTPEQVEFNERFGYLPPINLGSSELP